MGTIQRLTKDLLKHETVVKDIWKYSILDQKNTASKITSFTVKRLTSSLGLVYPMFGLSVYRPVSSYLGYLSPVQKSTSHNLKTPKSIV